VPVAVSDRGQVFADQFVSNAIVDRRIHNAVVVNIHGGGHRLRAPPGRDTDRPEPAGSTSSKRDGRKELSDPLSDSPAITLPPISASVCLRLMCSQLNFSPCDLVAGSGCQTKDG
jgi:hypothetical protein